MQRKHHVTSNICFHLHYKNILVFTLMTINEICEARQDNDVEGNCAVMLLVGFEGQNLPHLSRRDKAVLKCEKFLITTAAAGRTEGLSGFAQLTCSCPVDME